MTHQQQPLPYYDGMTVGSIESRVRALDADAVAQVLDYEREHAGRPQVRMVLEYRLESLRNGDAEPSGGDPVAPAPEVSSGAAGGSKVSPTTAGLKQNPPSQGAPTNPAQPRR